MNEYCDERTGTLIRDLTPEISGAQTIYHTHPMWTPNMEFLVFHAAINGWPLPHALEMKTGTVRPIVETSSLWDEALDEKALKKEPLDCVLSAKTGRFFVLLDRDLYALNVPLVFRNKAAIRKVACLPRYVEKVSPGCFSLDSTAGLMYAGVVLEEDKRWGLLMLNLSSGEWSIIKELDFCVGHVQANPGISRVIMFCHENGGNAPQRMWLVNANGTGLRPFHKETHDEWITHEVWWGRLRAAFTVWPYDEAHRQQPYGVMSVGLTTGEAVLHTQFPAWHVHGSADGKWLVADDFDRNLWLIKAISGERRLLTQGHLSEGFNIHPHPSFTPDGKNVIFNSSRNGEAHIFLAELPPWDALAPLI